MDLLPVEMTNFFGANLVNSEGISYVGYFKVLPTADVNAPLALALVVMFFVTYYTIANHGLGGFLKEFINPIELVGYFSKHVALALRLYRNLFAGEMIFILIGIMFGQFLMSFGQTLWFLPGLIMNLVWALFHILIIALQAYIFMMLTIAYINLALCETLAQNKRRKKMEELRLVAGALLTGLGALGAGIGIGTLTSKYIEALARQPELQGLLFGQLLIAMGLIDALPVISLAVGLLFYLHKRK